MAASIGQRIEVPGEGHSVCFDLKRRTGGDAGELHALWNDTPLAVLPLGGFVPSTVCVPLGSIQGFGQFKVLLRSREEKVLAAECDNFLLQPEQESGPRMFNTRLIVDGSRRRFAASFSGSAKNVYALDFRSDLSTGEGVEATTLQGIDGILTIEDPSAAGPARFYRLRCRSK